MRSGTSPCSTFSMHLHLSSSSNPMAGYSSERGGRPILLTGASGFIGRHLAPLILERGYALRVLLRDGAALRDCAWRDRAQLRTGDITNPTDLAAACAGAH